MATVLEDLATVLLPGAGLGLTFGTNLFAGIMPTSPDQAVSLFEYAGEEPEHVLGPVANKGGLRHPRVQVLVRVAEGNYLTGRNLIENVANALECANTTINGTYYERIERMQDPFFVHRDQARRVFFAINMTITANE